MATVDLTAGIEEIALLEAGTADVGERGPMPETCAWQRHDIAIELVGTAQPTGSRGLPTRWRAVAALAERNVRHSLCRCRRSPTIGRDGRVVRDERLGDRWGLPPRRAPASDVRGGPERVRRAVREPPTLRRQRLDRSCSTTADAVSADARAGRPPAAPNPCDEVRTHADTVPRMSWSMPSGSSSGRDLATRLGRLAADVDIRGARRAAPTITLIGMSAVTTLGPTNSTTSISATTLASSSRSKGNRSERWRPHQAVRTRPRQGR